MAGPSFLLIAASGSLEERLSHLQGTGEEEVTCCGYVLLEQLETRENENLALEFCLN